MRFYLAYFFDESSNGLYYKALLDMVASCVRKSGHRCVYPTKVFQNYKRGSNYCVVRLDHDIRRCDAVLAYLGSSGQDLVVLLENVAERGTIKPIYAFYDYDSRIGLSRLKEQTELKEIRFATMEELKTQIEEVLRDVSE